MNEVTKKTSNEVANVPDYLATDDTGADTIEPDQVILPRIKIVQKTSRDIKKAVKDVKDGSFYNALTNEVYGEKIEFYVLLFWKSRVWFSEDFKMLGTVYNDIVTKEEVKFGNDIEKCIADWDAGTDSFNFMVLPKKDLINAVKNKQLPLPYLLSCASAGVKPAKKLTTELKVNSMRKIPIYAKMTTAKTTLESFTKGDAYLPNFKLEDGFIGKEAAQFLKELFVNCRDLQRKGDIHLEVAPKEEEEKDILNSDDELF